jgi:hypothetical protein
VAPVSSSVLPVLSGRNSRKLKTQDRPLYSAGCIQQQIKEISRGWGDVCIFESWRFGQPKNRNEIQLTGHAIEITGRYIGKSKAFLTGAKDTFLSDKEPNSL